MDWRFFGCHWRLKHEFSYVNRQKHSARRQISGYFFDIKSWKNCIKSEKSFEFLLFFALGEIPSFPAWPDQHTYPPAQTLWSKPSWQQLRTAFAGKRLVVRGRGELGLLLLLRRLSLELCGTGCCLGQRASREFQMEARNSARLWKFAKRTALFLRHMWLAPWSWSQPLSRRHACLCRLSCRPGNIRAWISPQK